MMYQGSARGCDGSAVSVDDVVTNSELLRRRSRPPNNDGERGIKDTRGNYGRVSALAF